MNAVGSFAKKYPLLVNMGVCGAMYGGGDVSQQVIRRTPTLDLRNSSNIGVVGVAFYGPFYTYWYKLLDRFIIGQGKKVIFKKLVFDQLVGAPVCIAVFYISLSLLERREDILQMAKEKSVQSYAAGACFWPAVQAINFAVLPTRLRTVYVSCAAFVWTNILCYIKSI